MDLATIESTIQSVVENASGLQLEWGKQPQKMHIGAFILGYPENFTKKGHDERIQSYGGDGDNTEVDVTGVRLLPIRLSFINNDQRLATSSRHYAEKFRTLLHSQTNLDALNAADIALVDLE